MATLAAYDIHSNLKAKGLQNVEIVCYTFAAPRTGNYAFARQYNAVVPNTWSVINDQVRARNDVLCKVQTIDLMTLTSSVALTTRWPYDKGAVSAQHCMSACHNLTNKLFLRFATILYLEFCPSSVMYWVLPAGKSFANNCHSPPSCPSPPPSPRLCTITSLKGHK